MGDDDYDANDDDFADQEIGDVEDDEEMDSSMPQLCLSSEEKKMMFWDWKNILIVKLMGKNISVKVLLSRLGRLWQIQGAWRLIDLGESFFVVRFQSQSYYDFDLTGGLV